MVSGPHSTSSTKCPWGHLCPTQDCIQSRLKFWGTGTHRHTHTHLHTYAHKCIQAFSVEPAFNSHCGDWGACQKHKNHKIWHTFTQRYVQPPFFSSSKWFNTRMDIASHRHTTFTISILEDIRHIAKG